MPSKRPARLPDDSSSAKPVERNTADAFPSSNYSLLGRLLQEGSNGLAEARRHVMNTYAQPLTTYFCGSSFADRLKEHNGDADDIVRGFFADRLSRDGFLHDWLLSRRPLRYWLITAFKHHLYELIEKIDRENRDKKPERAKRPRKRDAEPDPETRYHHEMALWLVREAIRRTEELLAAEGNRDHWHAVVRHHLDGRGYRELARDLGVPQDRAKVMAMVAANRFRRTVEELVAWPGASAEQVRQEIRDLMEAIRS